MKRRHVTMWNEWNERGGPRYPHEKVVQFTLRNFPPGKREGSRALDLGCGTGVHAIFLASEGFSVTAVDLSGVAVARTRAELEARELEATVAQQGIAALDLPDGAFDLVICSGVLDASGVAETVAAIPRVAQTMTAGARGVFVFASDRDYRAYDAGLPVEIHGFSREEVDACFARGFSEVLIDRYITTYEGGKVEQNEWLVTVRR